METDVSTANKWLLMNSRIAESVTTSAITELSLKP
jgi:hypothetical protein